MNSPVQAEGGKAPAKSGFWMSRLLIPCLGITIVAMLCLLAGCGSDNASKGATGVKQQKAAKDNKTKDMRMITTLLSDKEGSAPPAPEALALPGNISREQMEANIKATEKTLRDPKYEVVPGLTMEKLEANIEAAKKSYDPKREVFPGMTLEQFNAKQIEASKQNGLPVVFGFTQDQIKANLAEAKQAQGSNGLRPGQVFPPK